MAENEAASFCLEYRGESRAEAKLNLLKKEIVIVYLNLLEG